MLQCSCPSHDPNGLVKLLSGQKTGNQQEIAKGLQLLESSANQGYLSANVALGDYHYDSGNLAEAGKRYQEALDGGLNYKGLREKRKNCP